MKENKLLYLCKVPLKVENKKPVNGDKKLHVVVYIEIDEYSKPLVKKTSFLASLQ